MRWLILIGDEKFDIDTIKAIKHWGCVDCYDVSCIKGRYCVDFGTDHIFYDVNESIEDFESYFHKIPYAFPHFITMTYTCEKRVKNILKQNDFPKNIYIDNGLLMPIKRFIELGLPLH